MKYISNINNKYLLKAGGIMTVGAFVAKGLSFFYKYLMALFLLVETYGTTSLFMSLFLSFVPVATFSTTTVISRLLVVKKNYDFVISGAFFISTISSFFAAVLFHIISVNNNYNFSCISISLLIFITYLSMSLTSCMAGLYIANKKYFHVILIESIDIFIKVVMFSLCTYFDFELDVIFLIYIYCIPSICTGLCVLVILIRLNLLNLNFIKLQIIKVYVSHGLFLTVLSFFTLFLAYLLRNTFINDKYSLAIFDFALTLYAVPKMVFSSVVRPLVPYFAEKNYNYFPLPAITKIVILNIALVLFVMILYIYNVSDILFKFIALNSFTESFLLFGILCCACFFDIAYGYLSSFLQGIGRIKSLFVLSMPSVIVIMIVALSGFVTSPIIACLSYVIYYALMAVTVAIYTYLKFEFRPVRMVF